MPKHPNANPEFSKPVRIIDGFTDRLSKKVSVSTTSVSLATLLGESILDTDAGVNIVSDGTLQYSPDGNDADTDSGFLPTFYPIHGGKPKLDDVRLYAAASTVVSLIVFEV